jgi:iron complex outermembrane recepter protein
MRAQSLRSRTSALAVVVVCGGLILAAPAAAQTSAPAGKADAPATGARTPVPAAQQAAAGTVAQKPAEQNAAERKPTEQKQAEQKTDQQPPKLDVEVLVTAPRIEIPIAENPAATTVVKEEVLQAAPKRIGAEEALWLTPGVKTDNQANGERVHISIRGQGLLTERGVRGIKVLFDGLPVNDPTGLAPDLFDVDWASVNRIEVLRGPSSALYGGGGSGGVINITTRDGGPEKASGSATADFGSNAFYKMFAEGGGTSENVNYHVTASTTAGDGYRVHTKFDAINVYGKARYDAGDGTKLTFVAAGTHYYNDNAEGLNLAQVQDDPTQANPDALTYNEGQRTNRFTTGVSGQTKVGDRADLSYAAYYRRTAWWESVPSAVDHRNYVTPGGNLQLTVHGNAGTMKNHLTIGSDVDWQTFDEYKRPNLGNAVEGNTLLADQTIDQSGAGVFAIDRLEFSPKWSAMLGLRYDWMDNTLTDNLKANGVDLSGSTTFSKVTGRIGAAYNPEPDIGIYASWGQGFLPPTTEELSNNPNAQGGFNQNLVPATSQGEELGVRGAVHGLAYDVAFFHLDTMNDFGRYRVKSRPLETFYGNLGATNRYGLETEVFYSPVSEAAFRAAYTYNHFQYTQVNSLFGSFSNTMMPNAPLHQFAFDGQYTFASRFTVGLGVFTQSGWFVDQSNVASVKGYTLVNPRLSYRLSRTPGRAELVFQVRNLLNTEYIAFTEPDPDGNSYQPGPTREAFVGLRVRIGR